MNEIGYFLQFIDTVSSYPVYFKYIFFFIRKTLCRSKSDNKSDKYSLGTKLSQRCDCLFQFESHYYRRGTIKKNHR